MEYYVDTTSLGVVDLAAVVLSLEAAFFLGFPIAGVGVSVGLGTGFLGLAVFLVAVNLGCTRDARGVSPRLRCVCPKRWQCLHCNGPFGARYDSTDTRKPQISVSDRTFDTSHPHATFTMK